MTENLRRSGTLVEILNSRLTVPDKNKRAANSRVIQDGGSTQIFTKHQPRFDQHTIAEPAGDCMVIHVLANGFWGQIIQEYPGNTLKRLFWRQTDILPRDTKEKKVHQNVSTAGFGENPNEPTAAVFGRETAITRVEFLGHPDTLVAEMMEAQEKSYSAERSVAYVTPDSDFKGVTQRREILLTTPVIHTLVKNTAEKTADGKGGEYSYPAQVMIFIEEKERMYAVDDKHENVKHREPSALRIGIGILADADQKLRVYYCRSRSISFLKKQQKTQALYQFLDAVYSLGERAFQEVHVNDVQNWEPRDLDDDQMEFLTPEVTRLRPRLSHKKKTRKKKSPTK